MRWIIKGPLAGLDSEFCAKFSEDTRISTTITNRYRIWITRVICGICKLLLVYPNVKYFADYKRLDVSVVQILKIYINCPIRFK